MKKAYINWLVDKDFSVGTRYAPTMIREDDPTQTHWSVVFEITEECKGKEGTICFSMLVDDNEYTISYFERLIPNTKFYLYEGKKRVACCYII